MIKIFNKFDYIYITIYNSNYRIIVIINTTHIIYITYTHICI